MNKIVILDGYTLNPGDLSWKEFEKLGQVCVYERTSHDNIEEIVAKIADSEIVITNKVPITKEIIERCQTIQYIGVSATGYNNVDIQAASNKNICVTNIPSYGTDAVAQFTFALLLESVSQVGIHNSSVHKGEWEECQDFSYMKAPLMELANKTIGLIGYGEISHAVADIAHSFKMNVVYYNHRPKKAHASWLKQVDLNELYKNSDIISLHLPLFPETKKMIDKKAICQMKDEVVLINTSRGGLLDEEAVAEALFNGKIKAVGTDVVSKEPIEANNPLLTAPNCWITPHIAWAAKETRARLLQIAVENLQMFLKGTIQNSVTQS